MEKIISFMLSLFMIVTTFSYVPQKTVNAEEEQTEIKEEAKDDYENQYFTDLVENGQLIVSDDTISVEEDKKSEGVVFTGNLKDLVISLNKTFNFDRSSVCRISIDALAAKSVKAELAVYLDDNTEPVSTVALYRQKKKNVWTYSKNISIDVADLKKNGYDYEGDFSRYDPLPKSITLTALYIPDDEVVKAQSIVLSKSFVNCPQQSEDFELEAQVIPFETTNNFLTWTSSNEDIVTVNDGMVHINGAGEADITVQTNNGKKASCHVHVFTEKELENKDIWDFTSYLEETEIEMNVGEYKQLKIAYNKEEPFDYYQYPYFQSLDCDIVNMGAAGVLYAEGAGTTTVYGFNNENDLMICRVTVVDPNKIDAGDVYTVKGLKYQVLTNKGNNRTVACVGAWKKNIKKVKIPQTVTIKNQKFKVKEISKKAFYSYKKLQTVVISNGVEFVGKSAFEKCKKLKKVTIGKNIQVIYERAFAKDKKLKNIVIKAADMKINKNAFKKIAKKAKFKVPKKSRKYYKIVLKNKR